MDPFVFKEPLGDKGIFVGRESEIGMLTDIFDSSIPGTVLLLGSAGIGKSSLLYQLRKQLHGASFPILEITLHGGKHESLTELLWRLSQDVGTQLGALGYHIPKVEKPMYMLRPNHVFYQQFWEPLSNSLTEKKIVFLFDDFDKFVFRLRSEVVDEFLRVLMDLQGLAPELRYVYTAETHVREELKLLLPELEISYEIELQGLKYKDLVELMRHGFAFTVHETAVKYLGAVTQGHPRDIQLLLHALYERLSRRSSRILTIADIMQVLASKVKADDFRSPVYRRRASLHFTLEDFLDVVQTESH